MKLPVVRGRHFIKELEKNTPSEIQRRLSEQDIAVVDHWNTPTPRALNHCVLLLRPTRTKNAGGEEQGDSR